MMKMTRLKTALIAFALAFSVQASAYAAGEHSHEHDGGAVQGGLQLNDGKKWQGDRFMITGMKAIYTAIAERKQEIHNNSFAQSGYEELAREINDQVTLMAQNCDLPPAVDDQFHIILGDVVSGAEMMQAGKMSRKGAVMVIRALNSYGKYFDHPGWQFF